MRKVQLGNTDMYVNVIGLGCMGLSHASGTPTPKDEAVEILKKAHEIGYDFYDTAECYTGVYPDGSISYNEEIVGEAIKDFRKDVILCTKFGVTHKGDHLELDSSPEKIRASLEGSLKRLQTDYVDIYYQHRIDPKVEPEVVNVSTVDNTPTNNVEPITPIQEEKTKEQVVIEKPKEEVESLF